MVSAGALFSTCSHTRAHTHAVTHICSLGLSREAPALRRCGASGRPLGTWRRGRCWGLHGARGPGRPLPPLPLGQQPPWRPRAPLSGLPHRQGPSRNLLLNGKAHPHQGALIRGAAAPVKRRRMNWIDARRRVLHGHRGDQVGRPWRAGLAATCALRGRLTARLHHREDPCVPVLRDRAARRPYKPIALRPSQALPPRPPAPALGQRTSPSSPRTRARPRRSWTADHAARRPLPAAAGSASPPSPAEKPLLGQAEEPDLLQTR